MQHPAEQLRRDALRIWRAGVDAVRSEQLVAKTLRVEDDSLTMGDERIDLNGIDRIVVVGAGKAGAGMAAGVEEALGAELLEAKRVTGWVNVPEDCVRTLRCIRLHGARPAGVNEPTEAGVRGAAEILRLVASAGPRDLCVCLISGGGSALLPAPVESIGLEDKLAVTQFLSGAGANIEQLNTVRKQLSRMKGGGLLRACRAGQFITLIISDVLGDPLDIIASGPTVENSSTARDALAVLEQFGARRAGISDRVFQYLEREKDRPPQGLSRRAVNRIIGNNATAVAAAGEEAKRLGYAPRTESAASSEGLAEDVGARLAGEAIRLRAQPGPDCVVSGGEPVVKLVEKSRRGAGGRNQQLVLSALIHLMRNSPAGIAMLSGGTDGEDGPTDAAGALLDQSLVAAVRDRRLDPCDYLARNDAYHFFEPLGGLIRTGPTDTNVCDVRVILVDRERP